MRDLKFGVAGLGWHLELINELRETTWASVVPHKIRQHIDKFIQDTQEFPARMRHQPTSTSAKCYTATWTSTHTSG
ncbi:dynein heavy chain [Entomophthora muscae]|uniref:Dynein heavy chain n=1 Tax=Entomophthora muscae TaxID=34485 RepID=A0ACC2SZ45_9FUNG|nr:dynein heavy chain [Entomophthora muscae]